MATNPIFAPLAPGSGLWYPTYPPNTPQWMQQAFRRAFDDIYQIQGQLSPAGVFAIGSGTVMVPVAPSWGTLTNCMITFARPGLWTVFGAVTFDIKDAADLGYPFLVQCMVTGLAAATVSTTIVNPNAGQAGNPQVKVESQPSRFTVAGVWQFTVTANGTAQLQVQKGTGADATLTSVADCANSSIAGIWCGN